MEPQLTPLRSIASDAAANVIGTASAVPLGTFVRVSDYEAPYIARPRFMRPSARQEGLPFGGEYGRWVRMPRRAKRALGASLLSPDEASLLFSRCKYPEADYCGSRSAITLNTGSDWEAGAYQLWRQVPNGGGRVD